MPTTKGVELLIIAELSFSESVQLEFLKALFTAVLVAVVAATAVWFVQRKAADRRERSTVARDLLRQTSECAGKMYYATQQYWKQEHHSKEWGKVDDKALEKAYLEFGVTGEQIEWELGARYGPASDQRETWHQVRDLLAIRYFTLKGKNDETIWEVNAKGYAEEGAKPRDHSGLTEEELETDSKQERKKSMLVLNTFKSAMDDLALALDKGSVRL
jgi:hypothetical protein